MTETDAGLVARLREAADDPTCTASYLLQEAADALASLSRAHEELKAERDKWKRIAELRDLDTAEQIKGQIALEAQVESLKAEVAKYDSMRQDYMEKRNAEVESLKAENATLRKGRG
jgi:hypothetical protein